jgi:hypothetical protein
MAAIISMIIAISALIYASYLHIYYHNRIVRSLKQVEEEKYLLHMKILGVEEEESKEQLKKFFHIEDLIKANKKLKKALKKHKLDS